nr:zinc finger MYM-type protein 3-like [Onthophagus taurus]
MDEQVPTCSDSTLNVSESKDETDQNVQHNLDNASHEMDIDSEKNIEENSENINELDKECLEEVKDETKTEFVTMDKNDIEKNEIVVEEQDPIAGAEAKIEGDEECILPDEEGNEEDDDDEKYIVTKINEEDYKECMECNKKEVPKYSCTISEKKRYICNENCLKVLKEKKAGKLIIRDLRVRTFAVVSDESGKENDNNCTFCNKPISTILYFNYNCMNFCTKDCLGDFQRQLGSNCYQCKLEVPETLLGKYCVRFGTEIKQFCKNSCLWEHKRGQMFCTVCQAIVSDNTFHGLCSLLCNNVSKGVKEKAICAVCKVQKNENVVYDNNGRIYRFCGDPCFLAYKYVNNVCPIQCEFCKKCFNFDKLDYSFWFLDKKHDLCSEDCKKLFIATNRKIVHCKTCNVKKYDFDMITVIFSGENFTICSLNCYEIKISSKIGAEMQCDHCKLNCHPQFHIRTIDNVIHNFCSALCLRRFKDNLNTQPEIELNKVKQIVVIKPHPIPIQRNVATMCKPNLVTKAISCRVKESNKSTQTDCSSNKIIVPIPVPIYVPTPLPMFSFPVPCPFPLPIPIPVPIFIPTTRNSFKGIQKEINRIKNKTPANPLEAELLMMAEIVADEKQAPTDSESDGEIIGEPKTEDVQEDEEVQGNFGEDVIQMALKMASDFDESDDLEASQSQTDDDSQRIDSIVDNKARNKSKKKSSEDKPDANMCLKYTFGVNAWKQWVNIKNNEHKSKKKFKTEILHTTSDELNYCLCLFVKEVRKPNGSEYAPDTIYYLCLGIQQYLYENGRIDNIFCDSFYEKFTDCLQEVCQKFSLLYNESQYIVTRVEEEHLWECKQLGAHSPLVLLNTLMFFNTKHFGLTTVEEHFQLSFSHIMKHWKRHPSQPGSRNVLLRFYPPQNADKPRKRKVYEQQENEQNPIRCPVKLYEFYLSKCPESVKTRNDVFYLQPERSCVPDSPVWYSTMPMNKEPLEKMLGRVKMVKEINVAILTC